MSIIKITKDGVSTEIIAKLAWAQATYPDHTCEDVTYVPTDSEIAAAKEQEAREWRDSELTRTDPLSLLPDHPQKTQIAAYRTALRDWPSTDAFPDTPPVLGG